MQSIRSMQSIDANFFKYGSSLAAGGTKYQRLSGSLLVGTDQELLEPWTFRPIPYFWWLMSWMIPGMGMFLEAYYIFRQRF